MGGPEARRRSRASGTAARRLAVVATPLLLGLVGGCAGILGAPAPPAESSQRSVRRSFAVAPGTRVELENLAGRVAVEGIAGGELEVQVTIHGAAETAEEAASLTEALRVAFEERAEGLRIRALYPVDRHTVYHYPTGSSVLGWLGATRTQRTYQGRRVKVVSSPRVGAVTLYADFHLRVPVAVAVALENWVGRVEVDGLEGDLSVRTASGDVTVTAGTGRAVVRTGSGDVVVADRRGPVEADTGSGDVEVVRVRGPVEADTGSGDVRLVEVEGERVVADTGSGDVELHRVAAAIVADTGSGDVEGSELRLGSELEVDTGSGDVSLAGDFSELERLLIETGSGDVDLRLTAAPPMDLQISTGSGLIEVEVPQMSVVVTRRGRFEARVAEGGVGARIRTGSGSVRIRAATSGAAAARPPPTVPGRAMAPQRRESEARVGAEIRFRLAGPAKPVILVPVRINGRGPFEFALDTGASMTVLSEDLAERLGIAGSDVARGMAAGGEVDVSVAEVQSLEIGEARKERLEVAIADLATLGEAAGAELDGIVGYDYLRDFRVLIDYPGRVLRLESSFR